IPRVFWGAAISLQRSTCNGGLQVIIPPFEFGWFIETIHELTRKFSVSGELVDRYFMVLVPAFGREAPLIVESTSNAVREIHLLEWKSANGIDGNSDVA
ncbi:MAG TPA: hypothetical protein VMS31_06770, partial [Pyrinomonadaceae bacterium]|nr:hypothetical protein [Pyrinomonadaceae bacterium]